MIEQRILVLLLFPVQHLQIVRDLLKGSKAHLIPEASRAAIRLSVFCYLMYVDRQRDSVSYRHHGTKASRSSFNKARVRVCRVLYETPQ